MSTKTKTTATLALAAAFAIAPALTASATNPGSKDGSSGDGCDVTWSATGIHDVDEADMPAGLRAYTSGGAYDPSNSGFAVEVSPTLNSGSYSQGRMEVQHYFTGSGSNLRINFRVMVATSPALRDTSVTVDLPQGQWTTSDATAWAADRYMAGQGHRWVNKGTVGETTSAGFTIDRLPENGVVAVIYSSPIDAAREHDTWTASARMTGTFAMCECSSWRILVTPERPAVYETRTVPGKPAVYETRTVPGKPAVYETRTVPAVYKTRTVPATKESNPVVGVFQVDGYRMPQKWVNGLTKDGLLKYREDKAAWGKNTWEFVTVTAKDVKVHGSLTRAINAKTKKVGNLDGKHVAWKLGKTAKPTVALAWGPKRNDSQILWTKVKVPAYRAATKARTERVLVKPATTQRVLVTPATPATTEQVLVTPATPATTESVLVKPAVPAVYREERKCEGVMMG